MLRFIRLGECRGPSARDFQDPSSLPLAPKGPDISAQGKRGGVSRQASPWGSLFVREEALKGRHRRWLTKLATLGTLRLFRPFRASASLRIPRAALRLPWADMSPPLRG